MLAKVVEGRKIGRTLGFPTANLAWENEDEIPENGVYAVNVICQKQKYLGLLNIGNRPTFGVSKRIAEVHILDFAQNIYGETLEIHLRKFIRKEKFFETTEALKKQIEEDRAEAKK